MAIANPQITFSVPFRLFKEDKPHLGKNLVNWVKKQTGTSEETEEMLSNVFAYSIRLDVHSYKPVEIAFSKVEAQKIFKAIFPNAKCLKVDQDYTQHKSKSMLPLIDFQIFFK